MNGGTCSVVGATTTYSSQCSCPTGFSGDRCQNTGTTPGSGVTLSTEAIIGIVVGVVGFILLLLLLCCCCWFFMMNADRKPYPEYGHYPMALMDRPMENQYERRPIMDRAGPVITELEEGHDNMMYKRHQAMPPQIEYDRRPQLPLPIAAPAPIVVPAPRPPQILGPEFIHEYDHQDVYGPGDVYGGHDGYGSRDAYGGRGTYGGYGGGQVIVELPPEGPPPRYESQRSSRREPRRNRLMDYLPVRPSHRRSRGPRFNGGDHPEPVGEMKRRLYHEFSY